MKNRRLLVAALASILVCVVVVRLLAGRARKREYMSFVAPTDVCAAETSVAIDTNLGTWVLSLETGQVVKAFRGLSRARWSPVDPDLLAGVRSQKKSRGKEILDTRTRLELHNLASGDVARWERLSVGFWQWSPDGRMLAVGTWPADRAYPRGGADEEGACGLAVLDVGRNVAFIEEARCAEVAGMTSPPVPAWRPDSQRVYFGGISSGGRNVFGYMDVAGGKVTVVDTNELFFPSPFDFKFFDKERAVAIRQIPGKGRATRLCGLLDVEPMIFEPIKNATSASRGRWEGLYQTRCGGPVYRVKNGAIYLLDAEHVSFVPVIRSSSVDTAPVFLAASNTILFSRNMRKVMRKDLATGQESCISSIDAEGGLVSGYSLDTRKQSNPKK